MIQRLCRLTRKAGRDSNSHGFTLIEILVASLLLLFAMAGLVPFFLTGLSQASAVRYKSIATNIARQKMEQVRQLDYREILDADFLEGRFGVSETQRDIDFDIDYAVSEEDADYGAGRLKKVTVTVSWADTEYVSPASMTTMIHQQFLGPRISYLEISPLKTDYAATIFSRLHDKHAGEAIGTTMVIHVAEADWFLIYDDLNEATMAARDAYARVVLFDDGGQPVQLGDAGNDYKITDVRNSVSDSLVEDVYFYHQFNSDSIPDGYWNLQATVFNEYDEPGNTWRMRVRVENGVPGTPTLIATPRIDNQTVDVDWVGGSERDRDYFVLQREEWDWDTSTWVNLTPLGILAPDSNAYDDEGYIDAGDPDASIDPWGTDTHANAYKYILWAVDTMARVGTSATYVVGIPDYSTTTTSDWVFESTTTSSTTTTEFVEGTGYIENNDSKDWTVVVEDETGYKKTYTVPRNDTLTISELGPGDYDFTATASGRTTRSGSFSMPEQDGQVIVQLSK
ncbi:MAG: prepilin-type N-terminal cleavage/methylation domain-containing protein [Thermoleophilia bacterium]|nr:prepilin-type N-terminal cleavage/methylation domain-containing protein [Thermoleophilia bacterium]